MTRFLVFGNSEYEQDNAALKIIHKLAERFPEHEFVHFDPTEGFHETELYIIDVVRKLKHPVLITEKEIERLKDFPKVSIHDFDLTFNLKLYLMLGKIKTIRLIGIPTKPTNKDIETICSLIASVAE